MIQERLPNRSKQPVATILIFAYTFSLVLLSYRDGFTMYSKLVALGIISYFGIRILRKGIDISLPLEFRFVLVWFLWAILTSIFASNVDLSIEKIITLVQVLVVSVALFSIIVWHDTATPYWISLIFASVVSSFITLGNPDAYIGIDGRIAGTVGNANLFSVVLNVGLAASITFSATFRKPLYRPAFLAASVFLFYMIAETGSRKGMIGSLLIVSSVFFILAAHYRRRSYGLFIGIVSAGILLIASGGGFLLTSQHAERLEGLAEAAQTGEVSEADNSLVIRAALIERALDAGLKHPILGIGLDNFSDLYGEYSHSNYMEILVSTGIPGLLLYIGIYLVLIHRLYSLRRCIQHDSLVEPYAICFALVLVTIAFDFAMVSYYEKIQWLVLSGLIAQLELLRRRMRTPLQ